MVPAISTVGAFLIWLLALKAAWDWRAMRLFLFALGGSWYGFLGAALYTRRNVSSSADLSLYPAEVLCVMVSVGLVMSLLPTTAVVAIRAARQKAKDASA